MRCRVVHRGCWREFSSRCLGLRTEINRIPSENINTPKLVLVLKLPQMATPDSLPPTSLHPTSVALNPIQRAGTPWLHLHIHSSQSVSLLFSLFVPVFFPSAAPSQDLTFFPLGSQSVLTGGPLSHSSVTDRAFPLFLSHSFHLCCPPRPPFFFLISRPGSPVLFTLSRLSFLVCLAKQLEPSDLFSCGSSLNPFAASLLLSEKKRNKSETF